MSKFPKWMLNAPEPYEERRKLSGYEMVGWVGNIKINDVEYWIENRRTDVQVTMLKKQIERIPNDDDLYNELVDDPDLKIEMLAKNILKNGLRTPIIVSNDQVLLDGNRRYLAHKWIIRNGTAAEKAQFEKIQAWVLKPEFSDKRHKLRVVTEYNYLSDFREPWSDFVKAKLLWQEHMDNNLSFKELEELYGGPGFRYGKIAEFIKTFEVIMEFISSSPDEDDAIILASENFIWFQQIQRSYRDLIRDDEEFQKAIFDNIRKGNIVKTDDLKWLKELKSNKTTWDYFKKGNVREAHILRQTLQLEQQNQPDMQMSKINSMLEKLLEKPADLEKISPSTLTKFHDLAEQVPGQVGDVNKRILHIMEKLEDISSIELATLSEKSVHNLTNNLTRVLEQAESTKKRGK